MGSHHRLGGGGGEGPAEHRELGQDALLLGLQQLPAPPEHGLEAAASGEQVQAVGEAVSELWQGQHAKPEGSQLDGQRQPVEGGDHLGGQRFVEALVGSGGLGPAAKQGERFLGDQGCELDHPLVGGVEGPTRGGEHCAGQVGHHQGGLGAQLLQVVEDQQLGRRLGEHVQAVDAGRDPQSAGRGDRLHQAVEVGGGSAGHDPGARVVGRDLGDQPGLADPARSDHGDQAGCAQRVEDLGELGPAADQPGAGLDQGGPRRHVEQVAATAGRGPSGNSGFLGSSSSFRRSR